jgi:hypothetical protein
VKLVFFSRFIGTLMAIIVIRLHKRVIKIFSLLTNLASCFCGTKGAPEWVSSRVLHCYEFVFVNSKIDFKCLIMLLSRSYQQRICTDEATDPRLRQKVLPEKSVKSFCNFLYARNQESQRLRAVSIRTSGPTALKLLRTF